MATHHITSIALKLPHPFSRKGIRNCFFMSLSLSTSLSTSRSIYKYKQLKGRWYSSCLYLLVLVYQICHRPPGELHRWNSFVLRVWSVSRCKSRSNTASRWGVLHCSEEQPRRFREVCSEAAAPTLKDLPPPMFWTWVKTNSNSSSITSKKEKPGPVRN